MRPALGTAWSLHLHQDRAYVVRVGDGQRVAALDPCEAVIVGLMDGRRPIEAIAQALDQALGGAAARWVQLVTARLQPLLVDGQSRPSPYPLESLVQVRSPDPREGLRRRPGPRVLHWWVTSYCPRRCAYCFAQPLLGSGVSDALITRVQLRRVFAEAAQIGAQDLLVAGAEPLLRPDLPEVLGDAIRNGLTPVLTTKRPITAALAQRLAAAGMQHISLSLDTIDNEQSRTLIGSAAYPRQVGSSMDNLKRAGIAFSLQTVATRINTAALRRVADFAATKGARQMQVIPFVPVVAPVGDLSNAEMALDANNEIEDAVERLAGVYDALKVELFDQAAGEKQGTYHCDVGQTKLFFLPDGVVHRCYKLIHDNALRGCDLRQVSVARAWHDPGFLDTLEPPRAAYQESSCGTCDRFEGCHREGRCIYRAWVGAGSYFSPDRDCNNNQPRSTARMVQMPE